MNSAVLSIPLDRIDIPPRMREVDPDFGAPAQAGPAHVTEHACPWCDRCFPTAHGLHVHKARAHKAHP